MSSSSSVQTTHQQPQVVYFLERTPPSPPKSQEPAFLDKVKRVAGITLSIVGIVILTGAMFALAGHLLGTLAIAADKIHAFFLTGMVAAVGGFQLSKEGAPPSTSVTGGPISFTVPG